jgi:hypothetical protein
VSIRIKTLVSVIVGCSYAAVGFAEPRTISVRVMPGGKACLIAKLDVECSMVSEILLREVGATTDDLLAISPDGCGEKAREEALEVVENLKKRGFRNVALVRLITEPSRACAP